MSEIRIPKTINVFYHILMLQPDLQRPETFEIAVIYEQDVFHGVKTELEPQRIQRGDSVWFQGGYSDLSKELTAWLEKLYKRTGCQIQLISWGTADGWYIITKLLASKPGFLGNHGSYIFPSYIRPDAIDIVSLYLVDNMNSTIAQAESIRTQCFRNLPEWDSIQSQYWGQQQYMSIVEAHIDRACYIKLTTKVDPTNEISTLSTMDIMDVVEFIEEWGLGYCLGRAVMNIYNANNTYIKKDREIFLKRAILCLEHANTNNYTAKTIARDCVYYNHLTQSNFIVKHSAGNANIDNAMLYITVARRYPNSYHDLISSAIRYLKNEIPDSTEVL